MKHWQFTTLNDIYLNLSTSIEPQKTPDTYYELFSVPSHYTGQAETCLGSQIGSNKQYVSPSVVLLCKINPRINRVWVVSPSKGLMQIASTEWIPFWPRTEIFPKYLAYFMNQNSFRDHLASNASGVGGSLMRIKPQTFSDYQFPICPLPEQKRIVAKIEELFSELDQAVETLKTLQQQLKIYRQAVLKAAVEGKLTEQWRNRQCNLPSPQDLCEFIHNYSLKPIIPKKPDQNETMHLIPNVWCWTNLNYVGDLARGKSKHRPRNDKILFDGPYPFIQTGDVKAAGSVIKEYSATYSEIGLAQSRLWLKGTLCITIAANIAETAFLGFDACFPDSIVGFSPNSALVLSRYIFYFFKANQKQLESYAPSTAQKNINLEVLENLIIPFCSLEEQKEIIHEIESRLSVADKIEETITHSLHKAEALRQSILKKAFEGCLLSAAELEEVRKELDWEPASVLLEKIKAQKAAEDTSKPSATKSARKGKKQA